MAHFIAWNKLQAVDHCAKFCNQNNAAIPILLQHFLPDIMRHENILIKSCTKIISCGGSR